MDLEYGFSCMGYELSGAWGAAMAHRTTHPDGLVTTILGDGFGQSLAADTVAAGRWRTPSPGWASGPPALSSLIQMPWSCYPGSP